MAKDTYYFSHDYNARNDPKILELRSEYGLEGLGTFWCIIETLAEDEDGYIIASLMGGLSVGYGIPKARLIEMIDFMVKIGLLCESDNGIFSRRLMEHKKHRKHLSDKGREGALKKWSKRDINSPPISPPDAKEIKGKERKGKEIIIEDELTFGNFSATFEMAWKEWIEYKKSQHNFSYKTKKTEQIAINSLIKQFPNQETKAIRAIEFSIGNGYQGIFAPNENQQSSQPQKLMNFR